MATPTTTTIRLNGADRSVEAGLTLAQLVAELGLRAEHVVTEVNGVIIAREHRAEHRTRTGDQVEIVHFVGGG